MFLFLSAKGNEKTEPDAAAAAVSKKISLCAHSCEASIACMALHWQIL